jgi:inhibitor of cysteine peptidase
VKKTMTIICLCLLLIAGRIQGAEPFEPVPAIGPEACWLPATPVTVRKGQTFALTLRSNPTTGYIWQLGKPPEDGVIQFIDNQYRGDKSGLVGAGGREIWTFKAVGTGETTIDLKYVRPWEKNTAPAKSALFKVVVSGDKNQQ